MIILSVIYYLNSDFYLLEKARQYRTDFIEELNSTEKRYLIPGDFIYKKNVYETKYRKNYWGENESYKVWVGYQNIHFRFYSTHLLIDFPYKWSESLGKEFLGGNESTQKYYGHVQEDIKFDEEPIYNHYRFVSIDSMPGWSTKVDEGYWTFVVKKWEVMDAKTGEIIEDILKERDKPWERQVDLIFEDGFWKFECSGGFVTVGHDLQVDYRENSPGIYFSYTDHFRYEDYVYDLKHYKPRRSWEDLIKGLFGQYSD